MKRDTLVFGLLLCTLNTWAVDGRSNKYNLPSLGTDPNSEYYADRSDHVVLDYTSEDLIELSAQSLDIYNVYLNYFDNDNDDFKRVNPTQSLIYLQSLVAQDDYVDVHNRNVLSSSKEIPSPQDLSKADTQVVASYSREKLSISNEIADKLEKDNGYTAYYSGNYGPKDVVVRLYINRLGDATVTRYYLTNEDKKDEFVSTKFDEFFSKIDKTGIDARQYTNEILGVFLLLEATPVDEMILGSDTYKTMERLAKQAEVYLKSKYDEVVEVVEFNGSYMSNRLRYKMGVVGSKYKTEFVAEDNFKGDTINAHAQTSFTTQNLDYRLSNKVRLTSNSSSLYSEVKYDFYSEGESATLSFGNNKISSSYITKKEDSLDEQRLTLSGKYQDWTLSGATVKKNGTSSGLLEATREQQLNALGESFRRSFSFSENESGKAEIRYKIELKHF